MSRSVSFFTAAVMILLAVVVDFVQVGINLIPPVGLVLGLVFNPIIDLLVFVIYYFIFRSQGINTLQGKNFLGSVVAFVSELVSDSILPGWTIWVILTLLFGKRTEEAAEEV